MAKRRHESQEAGPPTVDPRQGIALIRRQLEKGKQLLNNRPIQSTALDSWELVTRGYLEKAFGEGTKGAKSLDSSGFQIIPINASEARMEESRFTSLRSQLATLEGLLELLTTEDELQNLGVVKPHPPSGNNHRIFLVHGHDERVVQETARLLERLGQEVVILRDQPNAGKTIIEKFEEYSDVGFAVVLLTGDDRGGTAATAFDDQTPRARQNVIFEMGYFIGRLGRGRVCVLYQQGVEIPSDYSGVLYHEIDAGSAWRIHLANELRAANFQIDLNKAF